MKRYLYLSFALITITSCKKDTPTPSFSFKQFMDSLGLQWSKQYAYRHYSNNILFEEGYITINPDTSFTEISNNDTVSYYSGIVYTYTSNSTTIDLPLRDTIQGIAAGLKYTYYRTIKSSTLAFPYKATAAFFGYKPINSMGIAINYCPLAYYLQKQSPVFWGLHNDSVLVMPHAILDSSGNYQYSADEIIIVK